MPPEFLIPEFVARVACQALTGNMHNRTAAGSGRMGQGVSSSNLLPHLSYPAGNG